MGSRLPKKMSGEDMYVNFRCTRSELLQTGVVRSTKRRNQVVGHASAIRKSDGEGVQKRGTERDASYCTADMQCPCSTAARVSRLPSVVLTDQPVVIDPTIIFVMNMKMIGQKGVWGR